MSPLPSTPTTQPQHARLDRLWLFVLAAGVVLARILYAGGIQATYEDAFISLRYAENLASGLGLVYNPGERVFGASTPLYVLLLAGLLRLELPAILVAKGLAALADGATVFLLSSWLVRQGGRRSPAVFFALLFGLSPAVLPISVSGMETSFALLALTVALLGDLEDRPIRLGTGLGVLMLLRPDGLLAAAVLLGLRWWRTRQVPLLAGGVAALLVLPWIVFAALYYGSPIPHSIPAKTAAYNLHRESWIPNFLDTLSQLAPIRGPWGRFLATLIFCPFLILGGWSAWRRADLRPLVVLLLLWWAYLVLPRTLLFVWYFPLLLLPAFVLAAWGVDCWVAHEDRPWFGNLPRQRGLALLLCTGLIAWLSWSTPRVKQVATAERTVRRAIGEWLKENTPPDARIAMEPIGYIGYYSGRRILDEVGLVSPELVPLNRAGAGWFPEMLRQYSPDYVVERPAYLLRNLTINSRVAIFRSQAEREDFLAWYEPVADFETTHVPAHLQKDYRFAIYRRRSPAAERAWRAKWARLPRPERDARMIREFAGYDKTP